jgi:hypothetical protein
MAERDLTFREINRRNWIILLILSSISYFVTGHGTTLGVILGGMVVITNFGILQSTIRKAFPGDESTRIRKGLLIAKSFFRLSVLGVIIYLLITRGMVDPVGLAIGLSTVVFSIVSFGVGRALRSRVGGAF